MRRLVLNKGSTFYYYNGYITDQNVELLNHIICITSVSLPTILVCYNCEKNFLVNFHLLIYIDINIYN